MCIKEWVRRNFLIVFNKVVEIKGFFVEDYSFIGSKYKVYWVKDESWKNLIILVK